MHLGIGYSYRADDTATYELANDHPLDPSWKYTLSDVDGISLIGLEAALKLGYLSVQTEWVVADCGLPKCDDMHGDSVEVFAARFQFAF